MTKSEFLSYLVLQILKLSEKSDRAALCLGALRNQERDSSICDWGEEIERPAVSQQEQTRDDPKPGGFGMGGERPRPEDKRPRPGGDRPRPWSHRRQNFLLSQSSPQACSGGTCLSWRDNSELGRESLNLNVRGNCESRRRNVSFICARWLIKDLLNVHYFRFLRVLFHGILA